ncbi:MAG: DUF2125 domain-containing protein [Brevundimonas sp.]|nr:MAG: DUF2125 domain-containing protein [Brevundimonas sp.]
MTDVVRHSRRGLFAPFIIVGLLLAAWTGWWFYLASQVEQRLDAQMAVLRGQGWTINDGGRSLSGWPFRVSLTYAHPSILAPSGHGLAGPALKAEANAWDPVKWVVVAPDGLTQRWPNVALELVNPVFQPLPGAEPFPIARAGRIEFYMRPHTAAATAPTDDVDVLFRLIEAEGRTQGPVEGLAQDGKLTVQAEAVIEHASALSGMDAAGVFSHWTAAGGRFTRVRGEAQAGESRAVLSSDLLVAGPDGRLNGQVALKAVKPLPAISGLARSGSGAVNRVGAAGAAAATAVTGGQGDVDLELVFRNGRTYLGPFALAPAPKLF